MLVARRAALGQTRPAPLADTRLPATDARRLVRLDTYHRATRLQREIAALRALLVVLGDERPVTLSGQIRSDADPDGASGSAPVSFRLDHLSPLRDVRRALVGAAEHQLAVLTRAFAALDDTDDAPPDTDEHPSG